ncbi:hypothetical protein EVAR_78426_1 [Eumeta japonica]|uniref:Uncharacterized protein n=1 Tax=Eumeta variegata TaxID=151549 RepID=A0A4C1TYG1_EUMVA|nr:hypothetical protein EVAR_78426_1 [Eumeta japonica]
MRPRLAPGSTEGARPAEGQFWELSYLDELYPGTAHVTVMPLIASSCYWTALRIRDLAQISEMRFYHAGPYRIIACK